MDVKSTVDRVSCDSGQARSRYCALHRRRTRSQDPVLAIRRAFIGHGRASLPCTRRGAVHEPMTEDFAPRASIRGIHRAAYAQNWVPRKPLLSRRRPIERYNSEGIREALVEKKVRTRRQSMRPRLAASSDSLSVEFRELTTEADV